MPAAATDKFIKGARRWSGQIGASGVSDASVTTISLVSTTGLPTDTAVELTIDRVDASGNLTTSKEEIIRGVVSGTNIISAVRGVEGTAQAHSAGAVVEVKLTSDQWNRAMEAILAEHNQDGSHKIDKLDALRYAADAGSTDTYAITLTPAPATYYTGMVLVFKANTVNTGAATLNVNSLGAKTIKKNKDQDLADGDIKAGQLVEVVYDGTNFQMQSQVSNFTANDGWIPYSTIIPTRASADDPTYVLTFAGVDLTSTMSVGMKVKFAQNSATVYGIITAISFSTNTTVTLYCGTDYDVLDTATYAISSFNYSTMGAPLGFPMDPTKWQVVVTDASIRTQSNPTAGTWYNIGGANHQISVPIGAWDLSYKATGEGDALASGIVVVTLSTANNSESDPDFSVSNEEIISSGSQRNSCPSFVQKPVVLGSKTTFYLNVKSSQSYTGGLWVRGDNSRTVLRAISAYL